MSRSDDFSDDDDDRQTKLITLPIAHARRVIIVCTTIAQLKLLYYV